MYFTFSKNDVVLRFTHMLERTVLHSFYGYVVLYCVTNLSLSVLFLEAVGSF